MGIILTLGGGGGGGFTVFVCITATWSTLYNARPQYYFLPTQQFRWMALPLSCGVTVSDLSAIATSGLSAEYHAVAGSVVDRAVPPKKP